MTPDVAPVAEELRTLSVLIPVYNEQQTLTQIVDRVLSVSIPLQMEIVAVDDGSSDGSWEVLQELSSQHPELVAIQHSENRGKGAAIRTAIDRMTGDIAVIQDADLEYDPEDYGKLLGPILNSNADATFGSRYCGESRRVLPFWHSMVNYGLTLFSNMLTNLTLTDMETCYKMVRSDLLKRLNLTSNTFTLEPELTARLAQAGARIYEVPISYESRNYAEGKKIGVRDGIKAVVQMLRCQLWDRQCYATDDPGDTTVEQMSDVGASQRRAA